MLLILAMKSIDITKAFGNGRRDGAVELWLSKDRAEQDVQRTVIVIDYILLPYMQTLWKNILFHKSVNFL